MTSQIEICQDEENKSKLRTLLSHITKDNLVSEDILMPKIKENVIECTKHYEEEFISNQVRL